MHSRRMHRIIISQSNIKSYHQSTCSGREGDESYSSSPPRIYQPLPQALMAAASSSSSSSSTSPATAAFSLDHFPPSSPSEQLCCVHCNLCATILVVSVPCRSLLTTVRVRCGHCTNLFAVNLKGLLLLSQDEIPRPPSSLPMDLTTTVNNNSSSNNNSNSVNPDSGSINAKPPFNRRVEGDHQLGRMPAVNRPLEKRQKIPSAYNRFIKDEIQRIKAGNPDITHREAFSAAAKNWAHFPHIHFGPIPDQAVNTTSLQQQEEDGVLLKEEFCKATATDMGISNL